MNGTRRIVQQSEAVDVAGAPLVEIGDPRDLEIVVELLSVDAVKVDPEQRVIRDHRGGESVLEGRVRIVEPRRRMGKAGARLPNSVSWMVRLN